MFDTSLGSEASILSQRGIILPLWSCSLLEVGRNRPLPNDKCKTTGVKNTCRKQLWKKGIWFSTNVYDKGTKTCLQSGKSLLCGSFVWPQIQRWEEMNWWKGRIREQFSGKRKSMHLRNWKRAWVPEAQEKSVGGKMTDMLRWNQKTMLKTSKQDCIKQFGLYFSSNEKAKIILNGRTYLPILKITLISQWSMELVRDAKVSEKTH